jgi:DNA-binding beta-propeller fold protein YncE
MIPIITTVAGTGDPGYGGDGGPGSNAQLNEPKSVAVRGTFLYIADSENHRIRQLDLSTGIIVTVAGGAGAFSSAAPPSLPLEGRGTGGGGDDDPLADPVARKEEKYVQLADQSGTVRFVTGTTAKDRFKGDGGPGTEALLNFPSSCIADSRGNLYIADTFNHRVRRIDVITGIITTVAGTGAGRFNGDGGRADKAALHEPVALALNEEAGLLFIADLANYRVRVVNFATGVISTYAGCGRAEYDGDGQPAVEAGLSGPSGLALDPEGNLYIADTFSGRIRLVEATTGVIRTVAGDGTEYRYQGVPNEFSMSLSRPAGISLGGDGKLYITDSDNHLIRVRHATSGIITALAGNGRAACAGDGGPANCSSLNYPFGVAVAPSGDIFVADTFNHRIRVIRMPD